MSEKTKVESGLEDEIPAYLRLPKSIVDQLNQDSEDFKKSKDDVVALVLHQHFLMKRQARSLLYRAIPNKRAGRPIKK